LATEPRVRVRTKSGAVIEITRDDVVAVRALTAAPVRTSQIRATEHAAALGWPGIEHRWLAGWFLRAGGGHTHRANSAVPLGVEAYAGALPAIVDWYEKRGQTPWLSVPDRLAPQLPKDVAAQLETVVMVRDMAPGDPDPGTTLSPRPDERWLRLYLRDVPVDVLAAVIDGDVVFATRQDAGVGRAAVTSAPNGTRWVGLSAVRVVEEQRGRGHARALCSALLAWGAEHGATYGYVQVLADNVAGLALYESLGFVIQHRSRYVDARSLVGRSL
jgi:GNAT superfamily N-acetyltransferase